MVAEQTRSVSAVLEKIRTRGYWHVVIHPSAFESKRIPFDDLLAIIEKYAVRSRGWRYPFMRTELVRYGTDWIDQELDRDDYVEYWRLYQSGQFVDYKGLRSDWRDQFDYSPAPSGWEPGQYLSVEDTVLSVTEIFEFAARLALTQAYRKSTHVHIALTLRGMRDRALISTSRRALHGHATATIDEFPQAVTLLRETLVADARPLAVKAAREVFLRFGLSVLPEVLRDLQEGTAR